MSSDLSDYFYYNFHVQTCSIHCLNVESGWGFGGGGLGCSVTPNSNNACFLYRIY
jgi:hypothetical protein